MTDETTADRTPANKAATEQTTRDAASNRAPGSTARTQSAIGELSDGFVQRLAEISPMTATALGIPGHDDRLDDLSPDGLARLNELVESTVAALTAAASEGPPDDLARAIILERLVLDADRYRSGWAHANLNVIESPLQHVRMIFDLMPTDSALEQTTFAARMRAVPAALHGYQQSLLHAARRGQVAARRQIDKCAEQCATFAGSREADGFFSTTVKSFGTAGSCRTTCPPRPSRPKPRTPISARFSPTNSGHWRPSATQWAPSAMRWPPGSSWAPQSICRKPTSGAGRSSWPSRRSCARSRSGLLPARASKLPPRCSTPTPATWCTDVAGLQAWMQGLSDRAVEELGRSHFDIPEPIRGLECRIAPPGGGVGAYYTPPSDDFSRPGRMWWSIEAGRTEFTTWRETTTVYHEGVPGHHLQLATAVFQRDQLNDYQRLLAGTSGHAEGWALYAERLVRELGYLTDDGDLLGLLDSQLFRAARVVLDIGMHLELEIPAGTGFHEGETWTPELGLEFLLTRTLSDPAHCRDEIDRYLGWPGQAPSYKLGEQVWLEGRAAARARHSSANDGRAGGFDDKAFHSAALNLGGMGLDLLAQELARL